MFAHAVLLASPLLAPADDPAPRPWEHVHAHLATERDALAGDLAAARTALLPRARAEAPELVPRLEPAPPTPRETGYGLLPPEAEDLPLRDVRPSRQTYALESISTWYAADRRDAAVLAARAAAEADLALAWGVDEYARLRGRLGNLEDHLAYHDYWQREATGHVPFWEERASILADVRAWRAAVDAGSGPETTAPLQRTVRTRLAPFRRDPSLALVPRDTGRALPLVVHTDVVAPAFHARLHAAVEEVWNAAPAMVAAGLELELELVVVTPESLYPEGAPAVIEDEDGHLARFPDGSLVVTTGAASTNAWVGRSVHLSITPLSRRELAHELGHLLGFVDAYLRAWEGDPDGTYGVTFVEWTGILGGLMDDARRGAVTAAMVRDLVEAYGDA